MHTMKQDLNTPKLVSKCLGDNSAFHLTHTCRMVEPKKLKSFLPILYCRYIIVYKVDKVGMCLSTKERTSDGVLNLSTGIVC